MAENLPRQFGALAADTCVVLCLIILRVIVVALCVSYGKRMSEKTSGDSTTETYLEVSEVVELKKQLTHARNASERFGVFLEQVERLFPFLIHASIFLLPKDFKSHSNHQHSFTFASGKNGGAAAGAGAGGAQKNAPKLPMSASFAGPDDAIRQFVEKVLAFRSSNNLDWNNCCVFNLYKGRGPVVQSPPQWPVSCVAAYHAGVVVSDIVSTGDYAKQGPHFLDWKALHEKGGQSMIAVPMFSNKQVIAVLSLASSVANAFERKGVVSLLGATLAPYAEMLKYTTRRMEMQKIVNDIITPLEPHLKQKRGLQYAQHQTHHHYQHPHPQQQQQPVLQAGECSPTLNDDSSIEEGRQDQEGKVVRRSSSCIQRQHEKAAGLMSHCRSRSSELSLGVNPAPATTETSGGSREGKQLSRRREPGIGKHHAFEIDQYGSQDSDLDWGDFFFNLVSMIIVYVYFSKVAVKGETLIAILLCMGVAALDVILLLMRWLWFEQYIHYGFVLYVFQIYRVIVVPVANTWMSWRVLHNMNFQPELHIIVLLGVLLMLCVVLGIQVRFLLHTPVQLVSIFFAAISTPDLCGNPNPDDGQSFSHGFTCVGFISAVQLSLGFVLPALVMHLQDNSIGMGWGGEHSSGGGKGGDSTDRDASLTSIPHTQAKRLLLAD
ncbi:hypothetical protein BSKO_12937 [Bryopsis sp. KO-2023]|nr:hypothetical protein BSKO_12937 [Bryopsis sp. KO-2023]